MTGLGPKLLDPLRVSFVHITSLNLSNNNIQFLTPSIGLLRSLNSLNLGYVVEVIVMLVCLALTRAHSNCRYNKLRSLPVEICLLTELKVRCSSLLLLLSVSLTFLPCRCRTEHTVLGPALQPASVHHRRGILSFSDDWPACSTFIGVQICSLPRLSKLALQNNKISSLPPEIRKLVKLTHFLVRFAFALRTFLSLLTLSLPSSNQLVDIPETIQYMVSLRTVKLCNNR
jgi:Leucine-rich repeat (LRR) protein